MRWRLCCCRYRRGCGAAIQGPQPTAPPCPLTVPSPLPPGLLLAGVLSVLAASLAVAALVGGTLAWGALMSERCQWAGRQCRVVLRALRGWQQQWEAAHVAAFRPPVLIRS